MLASSCHGNCGHNSAPENALVCKPLEHIHEKPALTGKDHGCSTCLANIYARLFPRLVQKSFLCHLRCSGRKISFQLQVIYLEVYHSLESQSDSVSVEFRIQSQETLGHMTLPFSRKLHLTLMLLESDIYHFSDRAPRLY